MSDKLVDVAAGGLVCVKFASDVQIALPPDAQAFVFEPGLSEGIGEVIAQWALLAAKAQDVRKTVVWAEKNNKSDTTWT